jgi:hypothetical protein
MQEYSSPCSFHLIGGKRKVHMKEPILTFLIIFILLGGVPSVASNGTATIISSIESQSLGAVADAHQNKEPASPTSMSDSTILLLIATGLMGLAGVSRENNP